MGIPRNSRSTKGGVGGNNAFESLVSNLSCDLVNLGVFKIGSDL